MASNEAVISQSLNSLGFYLDGLAVRADDENEGFRLQTRGALAEIGTLGLRSIPILERLREKADSLISAYADPGRRVTDAEMSAAANLSDIFEIIGRLIDCLLFKFANEDTYRLNYRMVKDRQLLGLLLSDFGLTAPQAKKVHDLLSAIIEAIQQGREISVRDSPLDATANVTLPDKPPMYSYAPRMAGGIIKYLEDNWADHIKAGTLTRPDLRRIDAPAEMALRNHLRDRKSLPEHLHVPTKSTAIDRRLASFPDLSRQEAERLARAAARRREREPKGPT